MNVSGIIRMNKQLDYSMDKLDKISIPGNDYSYVFFDCVIFQKISIPVISITYRDGLSILTILSLSDNVTATVSSEGECTL